MKRGNGLSPPAIQLIRGVSVTRRINRGSTPKFSDIKRSMASLLMLLLYLLRPPARRLHTLALRESHHHLPEGMDLRSVPGR
jgi:hypothetical protein